MVLSHLKINRSVSTVLDAQAPGTKASDYIVLVANSTLPANFETIWKNSFFRVAADGGANRLFDTIHEPLKRSPSTSPNLLSACSVIPNVIKGDFDSIRPEIKHYYEVAGSQVIQDTNQDTTDLQKALSAITHFSARDERMQKAPIVIVGGLGGNISQELSNFNCMFENPERRMLFVGNTNIVFLLHPGLHVIMSPGGIKCGLIPLGNPAVEVTTTGLKWDLKKSELKFGGLVSSSNQVVNSLVEVVVSEPVLWTFDFNELKLAGGQR